MSHGRPPRFRSCPDTVPRKVIDAARACTGASQGCIGTIDGLETPEVLAASGMTGDERGRMLG